METDRELTCRLCLKNCGCGFEVIEDTIREIFKTLLLDLDMSISYEPVVCYTCLDSLIQCFDMKADHVQKNDNIIGTKLKNKKAENAFVVSDSGIKCRLCLELINNDTSTISLSKTENLANFLEKHFELASDDTQDLALCMTCYKFLLHHFTFISNCLAVENGVRDFRDIRGTNRKGQIKLKDVASFMVESTDKNSHDSYSALVMENVQSARSNECCVKTEQWQLNTDSKEIRAESETNHHSGSKFGIPQDAERDTDDSLARTVYKCHKCYMCPFQSIHKSRLRKHVLIHKSVSEIHKCKLCAFQTKHKEFMGRHMLSHKSTSEVEIFKCSLCPFKSTHKHSLRRHFLTHKSVSEIKMRKCKICPFQAKYKSFLERHMLSHRSSSEVEIFKCDMCPFQSKYKDSLQKHFLVHKSSSEIEMHKCKLCAYQTKRKALLQNHMLVHKSTSEVEMHKCNICAFQTKRKAYMWRHMLVHKSISEVKVFKCDKCPFKTKHSTSLQNHKLIHKSASETVMYKCATCAFETKRKQILQNHMNIHRTLTAGITMHKCKLCEFETKYEDFIRLHMLSHKSRNEEFKCDK